MDMEMEMEMDLTEDENEDEDDPQQEHGTKYNLYHYEKLTSSSDEDDYQTDADDEETEESVEDEEEEELEDDLNDTEYIQEIEAEPANIMIENIVKNNIKTPLIQYRNASFYNNLHEIVDEMINDFCSFCKEIPLNVIWSKIMVFIWCIIVVIIPIIAIHHHTCDPRSVHDGNRKTQTHPHDDNSNIPKSITEPLRNDYVRIMNDNGWYLTLNRKNEQVTFTDDPSDEMAVWNVEIYPDKDGQCLSIKLKNKETDKYLRIYYSPNEHQQALAVTQSKIVDCGGTGGVWTLFKVHKLKQIGPGCDKNGGRDHGHGHGHGHRHHYHQYHDGGYDYYWNCGGREEYSFFLESDRIPRAYLGYGLGTIWEWFAYDVAQNIFASKRKSKWRMKYLNGKYDVVQDIVVKIIFYLNTS